MIPSAYYVGNPAIGTSWDGAVGLFRFDVYIEWRGLGPPGPFRQEWVVRQGHQELSRNGEWRFPPHEHVQRFTLLRAQEMIKKHWDHFAQEAELQFVNAERNMIRSL